MLSATVFTYSLSQVLHHLRERSSFVAASSLSLRHSELAEEIVIELTLAVMHHRHHYFSSLYSFD
jgi:hypothetical protein